MTNARTLADAFAAEAVPFAQLDEELVRADIVVLATACPQPILTPERVAAVQRRRGGRMLFLVDLAVPRNADPDVGAIERVYLYDIDALGRIMPGARFLLSI